MHRGLPLAPYFPSNYPTNSHNALELFGVGRLEQLVTALPLHLRNPAMSTIFVEADQRAKTLLELPRRPVAALVHQPAPGGTRPRALPARIAPRRQRCYGYNVRTGNVCDHIQFHQVHNLFQEQEKQGSVGAELTKNKVSFLN